MQAGLTTRRLTLREIFPPAMLLGLSEKVKVSDKSSTPSSLPRAVATSTLPCFTNPPDFVRPWFEWFAAATSRTTSRNFETTPGLGAPGSFWEVPTSTMPPMLDIDLFAFFL
jgi:hypothetical protein